MAFLTAGFLRLRRLRKWGNPLVALLLGVWKFVEFGLAEVVRWGSARQLEAPADDGLPRLIAGNAPVGALRRSECTRYLTYSHCFTHAHGKGGGGVDCGYTYYGYTYYGYTYCGYTHYGNYLLWLYLLWLYLLWAYLYYGCTGYSYTYYGREGAAVAPHAYCGGTLLTHIYTARERGGGAVGRSAKKNCAP